MNGAETMKNTLILTLVINSDAQEYFTSLRTLHFPAKINYLEAHLTLFHNLPQEQSVYDTLESLSAEQLSFEMEVSSLRSIGNGVAFKIESPDLQKIHASLQNSFKAHLIPQDKQKLWPHITIQNKVPPEQAMELASRLNQTFEPTTILAEGFALWEYLNGPWKLYKTYYFK